MVSIEVIGEVFRTSFNPPLCPVSRRYDRGESLVHGFHAVVQLVCCSAQDVQIRIPCVGTGLQT
jgi:hypothetical protein